jgi:cytochrome c oxidase subunit IV
MQHHKSAQPTTYFLIFAALLALTGLTVWLGGQELGSWHAPLGLAVAAAKSSLIIVFFMHVLYGTKFTWIIIGTTLFFLAVLLIVTATDYASRSWPT